MRLRPVAWTPPVDPGLAGPYAANTRLAEAELWDAGGEGPEDVVVDGDGRVFTGLLDGRIVRFEPDAIGSSSAA